MASVQKAPDAFKTISELSAELGVAQHILRYWEGKFPELKPLQRAGNRRYYRPADVELARRIHRLLNQEGYTVRGVQQLLRSRATAATATETAPAPPVSPATVPEPPAGIDLSRLAALRDSLQAALDG